MSALLVGLLAAGCGRESEETVSRGVARQADAVCAKVNLQVGEEVLQAYNTEPLKKSNSEAEAIDLEAEMLQPIYIRHAEELVSDLEPLASSSGGDGIGSVTDALEDWIEEATADPREVVLNNDVFNEAREQATELGMAECARSPLEVNREG